jgi:hypothetical protein
LSAPHGFASCVDNYSRYSLVFFSESKDDVFEHFRCLALRLTNDNGTEFRNASFDQFCLEHGVDP